MGVGGVKSVPLVLVGTGGEGKEGTRGENSKQGGGGEVDREGGGN